MTYHLNRTISDAEIQRGIRRARRERAAAVHRFVTRLARAGGADGSARSAAPDNNLCHLHTKS